jgi:hypothetical protein
VSVLLREAHGFEGFLFRPVLPALHDQPIARLEDEDVRIADASAAGAFLPAQHRVQHRRSDHMVASVDQLQYLVGDLGERISESVSELLVRVTTDVRARVGFVCARVVDEFGIKVDGEHIEVASIQRRKSLSYAANKHRSTEPRALWQSSQRGTQPTGKPREANEDPFFQRTVPPPLRYERDSDGSRGLHVLLRHRPRSIPQAQDSA